MTSPRWTSEPNRGHRRPRGRHAAAALLAGLVIGASVGCSSSETADDSPASDTTASSVTAPVEPEATAATSTSATPTVPPPPGTVVITDYRFTPAEIGVATGESVTWQNDDEFIHWVITDAPDVLDSGEIGETQEFTQIFSSAGTYPYFCNIHNYMKGTITVG